MYHQNPPWMLKPSVRPRSMDHSVKCYSKGKPNAENLAAVGWVPWFPAVVSFSMGSLLYKHDDSLETRVLL